MLRGVLLAAVLAFAVHGAVTAPAPVSAEESVDSIAGQLMCQCGCGLVVAACGGVMDCSIGAKMKDTIADQLAQGKTRQEILDYFVSVYGSVVLAAPGKSGFNLSAWVMPFAAIAVGTAVLSWALRAWLRVRRPESIEEAQAPMDDAELAAYRARVEEELRQLAR